MRQFDVETTGGIEVPKANWGAVIDSRCSLSNAEDNCPRGRLLENSLAVSNKIFFIIPRYFFLDAYDYPRMNRPKTIHDYQ